MGYSTDFTGELKFVNELTTKQLAHLNKMLGEDCRDHLEWNNTDLSYINLELLDDFSGIKWDGSEKTYNLVEKVNLIISEMKKIKPDFELIGELLAQGEEIEDRWILAIKNGIAVEKEIITNTSEIQCPHCKTKIKKVICSECKQQFLLEDNVFVNEQPGTKKIDLRDKTVVITGTFGMTRDLLIRELDNNFGTKVSSSVSKNTDYLLVGEKPGNSKLSKAKSLGIQIITEEELINLIE